MIERVSFRNYKSLRNVDVRLERFTVLVGPNASGKTSVLRGLHALSRLPDTEPREFIERILNPAGVYSRNAQGPLVLEVRDATRTARIEVYRPGVAPDFENRDALFHPNYFDEHSWNSVFKSGEFNKEKAGLDLSQVEIIAAPATLVRFDLKRLAKPSYSEREIPALHEDGAGLPSMLAHIALSQPDDFDRVQQMVRRIVPSVKRIRFGRAPVIHSWPRNGAANGNRASRIKSRVMGDALVFDTLGGPNILGESASEGTLFVVGLAAVLVGSHGPRLILVDDLDHAIHPVAQRELVRLIRELLDADPELQIVATTHSPYLLDEMHPEELRLMSLRDDGSSACAELTQHPRFEKWKREMSSGEMWSLFGENWVGEVIPAESA